MRECRLGVVGVTVGLLAGVLASGSAVAIEATWQAAERSPATRPAVTRPSATRPAVTRPAAVRASPELLTQWAELDRRRTEARELAKKVTKGDAMALARKNHTELVELTAKFNEQLAPIAAAGTFRFGTPQPKDGIAKAVWLYRTARQVEAYNASRMGEMTGDEFGVFTALNRYREALGLVPVEFDLRLRDAARGHSKWMEETGTFEHESDKPGYKVPDQRVTKEGYTWRAVAENIAMGQPTADEVFKGWFESPGHHHNLVGDYTHMGVGKQGPYWTQNFASGEPTRAGVVQRGEKK